MPRSFFCTGLFLSILWASSAEWCLQMVQLTGISLNLESIGEEQNHRLAPRFEKFILKKQK